jgi:hypothetical protein
MFIALVIRSFLILERLVWTAVPRRGQHHGIDVGGGADPGPVVEGRRLALRDDARRLLCGLHRKPG